MRNPLRCLGKNQDLCFMAASSIAEGTQSLSLVSVDALLQSWQQTEGSGQGPGTTWKGTMGGFVLRSPIT